MTVLAVYLELTSDLSTDLFIMALRRYKSRRGHVHIIRSDNGTNIVGAASELKNAFKSIVRSKLNLYCCKQEIDFQWIFTPTPLLVRGWGLLGIPVKIGQTCVESHYCLDRVFTDEAPNTFFSETECIINQRP